MTTPASESSSFSQQKVSQPSVGHSAILVAAGIFLSRIAGLVRDRVFSHFFGLSAAADAFRAAMRNPNVLQNLLGEGVLSASFIPVYAKLMAQSEKEEAGRVAGVVLSFLALATSVLVLVGVAAAPWLIDAIAPGFHGETRMLTIQLVRILFPGVGMLVFSAWCLGVLNSHRKFFLSYASPVVWNAVLVATMLLFGRHSDLPRLAVYTAWGSVVGSGLQFLVQLPVVFAVAPALRFSLRRSRENVQVVVTNFIPAFLSRGVAQLSAYVDAFLASYLPTGAVASLSNAQTLYMLPVSLFGMSISAAELPGMSETLGNEQEVAEALRKRLALSTRRIGFFVVPSAVAFLALGDIVSAAIYQTGKFTHADALYVWGILAGSAVGLVASTIGRLYSSAYYALRDTRTPLRFAVIRVVLTTGLGYLAALRLPGLLGIDSSWGVAGLTASAGFSAWVEFLLLRRGMDRRIGITKFPTLEFFKLWSCAVTAALVAWGVKLWLQPHRRWIAALLILVPYALIYLALTALMGINQAASLARRLIRR